MPTIDLLLTPLAAGCQADWSCDGRSVGPPIPLDAAAVRTLRDLAPRFLALFEQGHRPFRDQADLCLLGRTLFDLVFAPAWPAVQAMLGPGPRLLLLHCADPDLLNLPWELVELHSDLPLGCDPAWGLLRVPAQIPSPPPDPGPLRLLFLAAAPTDQAQLDFEREEDAMLQATGRLGQEVVVLPFAETGGIDELAALVAEHRPHVVHLSGHGIVDAKGVGHFNLRERARPDRFSVGRGDCGPGLPRQCRPLRGAQRLPVVAGGGGGVSAGVGESRRAAGARLGGQRGQRPRDGVGYRPLPVPGSRR